MQLRSEAVILLAIIIVLVPAVHAEDAQEWYMKGQNAATVGNWAGAITYYNNALAVDPKYSPAMAQKAVALNQLGKYTDALTQADQALSIKSSEDALNARAYALFRLGRYEDSIAAYDKLFTVQTNRAEAYCNQGTAYFRLDKIDKSITALSTCTRLMPQGLEGWNQLGLAYLAQQKYEQALDAFNRCTQITTGNAEVWNNKGKALVGLGKYQDARSCFDKALDLNPLYTEAERNKAAITGLGQNYNISGTVTPTEVPVRLGTTTMTTVQTPVAVVTTELPAVTPPPAEVTAVTTDIPVTKKTTYSPLSPAVLVVALIATVLMVSGIRRMRK